MVDNSIFFEAKSKRLAGLVDITSPTAFREGLRKAKQNGFSLQEFRAFDIGQKRSEAQLKRKNLSAEERKQFTIISNIRLPAIGR